MTRRCGGAIGWTAAVAISACGGSVSRADPGQTGGASSDGRPSGGQSGRGASTSAENPAECASSTGGVPFAGGGTGGLGTGGGGYGGVEISALCDAANPGDRVCVGDTAWYVADIGCAAAEACPVGSCSNGCCHATSDPCPTVSDPVDCTGDCYGVDARCTEGGASTQVPEPYMLVTAVRLGSTASSAGCGRFVIALRGADARLTIGDGWSIVAGTSADPCSSETRSSCLISPGPGSRTVTVFTDSAAGPRNLYIESVSPGAGCYQ